MSTELVVGLATLLLGGGAGGGLLAWWVARKKTPAEVDSIIVGGAEKAVLVMRSALEAEQSAHAATRAERDFQIAENLRKTQRIVLLEDRLDRAQVLLDDLRTELAALRADT